MNKPSAEKAARKAKGAVEKKWMRKSKLTVRLEREGDFLLRQEKKDRRRGRWGRTWCQREPRSVERQ